MKDELVEACAREILRGKKDLTHDAATAALADARSCLSAIESAGMVVVPRPETYKGRDTGDLFEKVADAKHGTNGSEWVCYRHKDWGTFVNTKEYFDETFVAVSPKHL